jgi:hypothetical protein
LENKFAGDSTMTQQADIARTGGQFLRRNPGIWVAVVLWLASNVFVTEVSKFATWEGNASYYSSADLCRWDCGWFGTVLESEYDKTPSRGPGDLANWPFHPLFPLTTYPFRYWLKLSLPTSVVFASKSALLFAIYGFLLMVGDGADTTADRFKAGSLVAFNPYLIYAHAGYSEPLYFALLAFAFYFASRARWIASGVSGALLSATRLVGFLFSISYAMVATRNSGWRSGWRKCDLNRIIGFLLCPLGTAIYMLYLYHHTGDALAQIHIQTAWGKTTGNPFHLLWLCLRGHHWLRIWGAMVIAALGASIWLFKLRKPELGIYLAISILIPLSAGSLGIARYIWWQPPFLCAIYWMLKRHAAWWVVYAAFAAGMASFMILEWFSGHNFVV